MNTNIIPEKTNKINKIKGKQMKKKVTTIDKLVEMFSATPEEVGRRMLITYNRVGAMKMMSLYLEPDLSDDKKRAWSAVMQLCIERASEFGDGVFLDTMGYILGNMVNGHTGMVSIDLDVYPEDKRMMVMDILSVNNSDELSDIIEKYAPFTEGNLIEWLNKDAIKLADYLIENEETTVEGTKKYVKENPLKGI